MTAEALADQNEQAVLMEEYMDACGHDQYFRKSTTRLIKMEDGSIVRIRKPDIETKFCFGYGYFGSYATDVAASEAAEQARTDGGKYFKDRNLKAFDDMIKTLEDDRYAVLHSVEYDSHPRMHFVTTVYKDRVAEAQGRMGGATVCSDRERHALIDAWKKARAKFEKRLDTYLKKYGTSKLDIWTYWADD